MKIVAGLTVAAVASGAAFADIVVTFDEGAPKDRFTLVNDGTCPLSDVTVTIDLGASAAGLIFDVTARGAGVQVFQPLELVAGRDLLGEVPDVRDGDNSIALPIADFAPGAQVAFTIDVDDTVGTREITVSGAEIEGAKVFVSHDGGVREATFGADAIARVGMDGCNA
ncbi:aggregation factor core [Roseobacter denitrificans]|uniref:Probable aggregation factor core n=1 Tax=Roseobacter denitrificans (strain ATCC 33942 / OCh 114) TaxID=375451 RepID=Q16AK5_ROSDO|nr:hypothetical protein [Roseobacter denitrificans]ABG30988.1 probable aggregation factor core [Roseobacter denitrificans OCh 114]AVL54069.1 aggregation factor core [Roseobacter denitrificans]SFG12986.1 hypothetical protein SAMN05443635_10849 [Roseobacter denitrificans OCh 114]